MPNDANNNKDIVLHCRDDGLKHISELHIGAMTHCNIPDFIGSGKGGAMGLQPHLILRVLHRIFIFYHRNIFFSVS